MLAINDALINLSIPYIYNVGFSPALVYKRDEDKWKDNDPSTCQINTLRLLLAGNWKRKTFTITPIQLNLIYRWTNDKKDLKFPFVHEIKRDCVWGLFFFPIGGYSWSVNFEYNILNKIFGGNEFYFQILSDLSFFVNIVPRIFKNRLVLKSHLWAGVDITHDKSIKTRHCWI